MNPRCNQARGVLRRSSKVITVLGIAATQASKDFGISGRMKLALLTKISSEKAGTEADSPENIELFEQTMFQLMKAA